MSFYTKISSGILDVDKGHLACVLAIEKLHGVPVDFQVRYNKEWDSVKVIKSSCNIYM